jgi:hypothetical protein
MRYSIDRVRTLLLLSTLVTTEAFMITFYTKSGCRYDKISDGMQIPSQGANLHIQST